MRTSGIIEHPEVIELIHICSISPDGAKEVCELFKMTAVDTPKEKDKIKAKKRKKDKELDRDLKDTFPASDPFTHY